MGKTSKANKKTTTTKKASAKKPKTPIKKTTKKAANEKRSPLKKIKLSFNSEDLVIVKLDGLTPCWWPGTVEKASGNKYHVLFYGSRNQKIFSAHVAPSKVFDYLEYKDQLKDYFIKPFEECFLNAPGSGNLPVTIQKPAAPKNGTSEQKKNDEVKKEDKKEVKKEDIKEVKKEVKKNDKKEDKKEVKKENEDKDDDDEDEDEDDDEDEDEDDDEDSDSDDDCSSTGSAACPFGYSYDDGDCGVDWHCGCRDSEEYRERQERRRWRRRANARRAANSQ